MLNDDYREMLQILLGNRVRFLVVGAYALGAYGYPRATGDFDIWVEPSPENSKRIYASLSEFGAPLSDISESTFSEEGVTFQIGVAPRRIDILTGIDAVEFPPAFKHKLDIEVDGLKIPFLSKSDLIKNKRATGRPKDSLDADNLSRNQDT
jgi:hypothetical protein